MEEENYRKLMDYALWLLGRKEYSVFELQEKFARRKIGSQKEIKKVLRRLKELDLLDDQKLAEHFVHSRCLLNPKGRYLLEKELKRKGIEEKIIEEVFGKVDFDEKALAEQVFKKKLRYLKNLPQQKKRQRLFYFLGSRGFPPDIIYKLLSKI